LQGFEIKPTDKCDFCGETTETLVHLFCTCKCVSNYWSEIEMWLSSKFRCNLTLTNFNRLFGFFDLMNKNITSRICYFPPDF